VPEPDRDGGCELLLVDLDSPVHARTDTEQAEPRLAPIETGWALRLLRVRVSARTAVTVPRLG
jgi:hypothetical protein